MSDIVDEYGPATSELLNRTWGGWGVVDQYVIGHLISPAFMGGPRWPTTRQAHLIARRDGELLVASDGLADPVAWDDAPPSNGFGVEVYGMTGDRFEDASTTAIPGTWLGLVVRGVSSAVAEHGAVFGQMLEAEGTLTIAFNANRLPDAAHERFVDDQGLAVVMLGVTGPEIPDVVEGPLSPIRLVNAKLLTAAEGAFCVRQGSGSREAREELVRRFQEQGNPLYSSLDRPSTVG